MSGINNTDIKFNDFLFKRLLRVAWLVFEAENLLESDSL